MKKLTIIFKKIIFLIPVIFLLVFAPFMLYAQEKEADRIPKNEFWADPLRSSFSYKRKLGKETNTFFRTSITYFSNSSKGKSKSDTILKSNTDRSMRGALRMGLEFRSKIDEKLYFFYGPDIIGQVINSKWSNTSDFNYQMYYSHYYLFGIGLGIGAIYSFSKYFSVGCSWLPSILYGSSNETSFSFYKSSFMYNPPPIFQVSSFSRKSTHINLGDFGASLIFKI